MLHGLILIPYYFFGALAALPLLMIVCRVIRLKVPIHVLVGIAIASSVGGIALPLILDLVDLQAFTARPMLLLGLASFVLAAIDGLLEPVLPLPLDKELQQL